MPAAILDGTRIAQEIRAEVAAEAKTLAAAGIRAGLAVLLVGHNPASEIYVRGKVRSLGADARFEPMTEADFAAVKQLLAAAGLTHDPHEFKRIASAKSLYHWNADANQEY